MGVDFSVITGVGFKVTEEELQWWAKAQELGDDYPPEVLEALLSKYGNGHLTFVTGGSEYSSEPNVYFVAYKSSIHSLEDGQTADELVVTFDHNYMATVNEVVALTNVRNALLSSAKTEAFVAGHWY